MLNFLINILKVFSQSDKGALKGAIEIDRATMYLSYDFNKRAITLPFFIVHTIKFIIMMSICATLLSIVDLSIEINIIVYSIAFFFFILICMSIYGTDTGDYIKINTSPNIRFQCVHQEALKSLFSVWFSPMFIAYAMQAVIFLLAVYGNKLGSNLSGCILLVIIVIFAEIVVFGEWYISVPKNKVLTIQYGSNICIFLKNGTKMQYECSTVIVSILKNNDILLRDKEYAYYTTKMLIVEADNVDYIQFGDINIRLKDNKWTIV